MKKESKIIRISGKSINQKHKKLEITPQKNS